MSNLVIKREDGEENGNLINPNTKLGQSIKSESGQPPQQQTRTYRDFPIFSTAPSASLHHIMRFDSHLPINPSNGSQFTRPLKLNRKREPRFKQKDVQGGEVVLDRWGKQLSEDGKLMMWPRDGNELRRIERQLKAIDDRKANTADANLMAPGALRNSKKNAFQKKVREVHKQTTAKRRVHNMEMFPWVLEDDETSLNFESALAPPKAWIDYLRRDQQNGQLKEMVEKREREAKDERIAKHQPSGSVPKSEVKTEPESAQEADKGVKKEENGGDSIMITEDSKGQAPWIGRLEGEAENAASSYVLFVFDQRERGAFKVIPVSRQYKFMQKPKHATLTPEEAEKQSHRSNAPAPGSARARIASVFTSKSDKPRDSGRRLMAVNRGRAGDSDDERHRDDNDNFGEMDFEEDFADDEERYEGENAFDEAEMKEMEERLKREMAQAERAAEAEDEEGEDEDEKMNEDRQVTGTDDQMKKMMRSFGRATGNDAYEDDEDKDPYADQSDEDEGMEAIENPEKAIQKAREDREQREKEAAKEAALKAKLQSKSGSATPLAEKVGSSSKPAQNKAATSMAALNKKLGGTHTPGAGHASVAQRATSPSRTSSGLPRPTSSEGSKKGSRSSSPTAEGRGVSPPVPGSSTGHKRKSPSATNNTGEDSSKRARTGGSGSGSNSPNRAASPSGSPRATSPVPQRQPQNDLERELIDFIRSRGGTSLKDCLALFNNRLKAGVLTKTQFSDAMRNVLTLSPDKTTLRIRSGY